MPAPRFTEEFCNREYNNRARVPGNEQLHAAHVAQSYEVRRTARCLLDPQTMRHLLDLPKQWRNLQKEYSQKDMEVLE